MVTYIASICVTDVTITIIAITIAVTITNTWVSFTGETIVFGCVLGGQVAIIIYDKFFCFFCCIHRTIFL